jgi:hypothetical protein
MRAATVGSMRAPTGGSMRGATGGSMRGAGGAMVGPIKVGTLYAADWRFVQRSVQRSVQSSVPSSVQSSVQSDVSASERKRMGGSSSVAIGGSGGTIVDGGGRASDGMGAGIDSGGAHDDRGGTGEGGPRLVPDEGASVTRMLHYLPPAHVIAEVAAAVAEVDAAVAEVAAAVAEVDAAVAEVASAVAEVASAVAAALGTDPGESNGDERGCGAYNSDHKACSGSQPPLVPAEKVLLLISRRGRRGDSYRQFGTADQEEALVRRLQHWLDRPDTAGSRHRRGTGEEGANKKGTSEEGANEKGASEEGANEEGAHQKGASAEGAAAAGSDAVRVRWRVQVFSDSPHPPVGEARRLFASAAIVVGVHGAALANMLFCKPGEWAPPRAASADSVLEPYIA